jgi:hypothetical protein
LGRASTVSRRGRYPCARASAARQRRCRGLLRQATGRRRDGRGNKWALPPQLEGEAARCSAGRGDPRRRVDVVRRPRRRRSGDSCALRARRSRRSCFSCCADCHGHAFLRLAVWQRAGVLGRLLASPLARGWTVVGLDAWRVTQPSSVVLATAVGSAKDGESAARHTGRPASRSGAGAASSTRSRQD